MGCTLSDIRLTGNWRTVCPADGGQNQRCWQIHSLLHEQKRPWSCLFEEGDHESSTQMPTIVLDFVS